MLDKKNLAMNDHYIVLRQEMEKLVQLGMLTRHNIA